MVLLELATQGVRGFPSGARLALKPGYTLLAPNRTLSATQGAVEPSSLLGLCCALLYSSGRGDDGGLARPGEKGKAALTFQGADGATYRVVRELGGGGALHQLHPAGGTPTTLSQSAVEISQYLRGQLGLPSPKVFKGLFGLEPDAFPSRRPRGAKLPATTAPPSTGQPPQLLPQIPVSAATDLSAAQAHLAELQRELKLAQEIEALQFKLDGLASQQFELERLLAQAEKTRDAARMAEESYRAAPTASSLGLPDNIVARLERHPRMVARRDEALARLEEDKLKAADEDAARARPEPLAGDLRFWGAMAVGAAALVGGALAHGVVRYVALLDLPAFGLAAALSIKYIDALADSGRTGWKADLFEKRAVKISEEFESENEPVKAALTALGVQTPTEAIEALGRKARLEAHWVSARETLAALEASPEQRERVESLRKIQGEVERLNAMLLEKGGYVRDVREVEREAKRVRESIELAHQRTSAPPLSAEAGPVAVVASGPESCEDPGPGLLALAADLWSGDLAAAGSEVGPRCLQYLAALSDKRYTALDFGPDGRTHLTGALGKVSGTALGPRDADLLYLAIKLSLLERACGKHRVPLIWEEGHGAVDEGKWPLLARMLKHVATLTQVVQVCDHPAFASEAEVKLEL